MEKRLDDNDIYIASLQEKIKTLVTDKDTLLGRTKQLEEEKEIHQVCYGCLFVPSS
jgi:Tax1-binding protein 1